MLEAVFLGILQGLTEFLPISSSAHIRIAGALFGIDALVIGAVAMALAAAFLNAAFNFCLGCEIYLLLLRARSK